MHELYAEQLARAVGGGFIDETTARAILTDAIARPDRTAGTSCPICAHSSTSYSKPALTPRYPTSPTTSWRTSRTPLEGVDERIERRGQHEYPKWSARRVEAEVKRTRDTLEGRARDIRHGLISDKQILAERRETKRRIAQIKRENGRL